MITWGGGSTALFIRSDKEMETETFKLVILILNPEEGEELLHEA